ncbi:hypothetical protein PanWU01x14_169240 [Parasponia andersonii]|uniref:THH1/TOM1/TOM3 domain-containing protein n=1 Tax=Parasponia andersonii TaxID=3476 RepID=A0A2P5CAC0_PARAD|nr:hypothetical protein PanWU01x14_169240 [Parasponia andersonii]
MEVSSSTRGEMSSAKATIVVALKLIEASNWWNDANQSLLWLDHIFHLLTALYAAVTDIALARSFSSS